MADDASRQLRTTGRPGLDLPEIALRDIRIQIVLDFMHHNLEKRPTLSELGQLLDLSESRFRSIFVKETGVSPQAYLQTLRLERAKELLTENGFSVEQIAMKVGWQDRSHFERRFKKLYGVTPVQYRKEQSQVLMNRLNY